jgi:sugar lactone lactonase YvrE
MRRSRPAHLFAALLLVALAAPGRAAAQDPSVPPDTVTTLFDSDTIPGFGAVGGVAVDAFGYLYIADFRNAVWRLLPDGTLEKFADGFYGSSGNAIGPRGELYQSSFNGNYISVVERDGTVKPYADEGLSGPVGIAVGPDGSLFVCNCNAGNIARVAPDRTVSIFAESELFSCPNGITFDDRGDLYVVDFNNPHVLRITPDGEVSSLTQITGAGGNGHIAFGRDGFYVTQFRGHRIFRMERDGSHRVVAGTGQPGETDGDASEATFTRPNGIAISSRGNVLWVNDFPTGPIASPGPTRVVMRRIHLVALGEVLANLPPGSDPEVIREVYDSYREARPEENTAFSAIGRAFLFLSNGRVADGLTILQLNAESYPDDANSQYQLGEGFRYTGQMEKAAEQYERTLELDPDHPQAQARLEMVQGG